MSRAVIDQPGIRVTFIGLVLSLFLGLALKSQISERRIETYLNKSVQRLQGDFNIDYEKARVNLSKWGMPFPVLEVFQIRLSPKDVTCQNSQIFVDELEVPISISVLLGVSTKVPKIRFRNVELRLDETGKCLQMPSPIEKTPVVTAEAHSATVSGAVTSHTTETPNKNLFVRNTRAELKEIFIEKLKIILSKRPEQPILLKQLNIEFDYADNKLSDINIRSKINALKDAKSDIYFVNANLILLAQAKNSNQIDTIVNVEGKLLDGNIRFFAHHLTSDPKVNYELNVAKVSTKALMPILTGELQDKAALLEKMPMSFSLNNTGEVFLDKNVRIQSKIKKLIINVDNAQVKSNEISLVHQDGRTTVKPFEFLIDALPLTKIKNSEAMLNKLDSFESLGTVTGRLVFTDEKNIKFNGLLRNVEVVFSNRGRRDFQNIDEMSFQLKRASDQFTLEAHSLVVGGQKVDGLLTVLHNDTSRVTQANLKMSGVLFNKKIWDQFTFVEQEPKVDVQWSYKRADVESNSLKLNTDSLELPGVLFSNLSLDLSQTADPETVRNNINVNIRSSKVLTNEKFLTNEYIKTVMNESMGLKNQQFSGDKTSIVLTGTDWRNLNFNLDSNLVELKTRTPVHLTLKGNTSRQKGVNSQLRLNVKNAQYKFSLKTENDNLILQAEP